MNEEYLTVSALTGYLKQKFDRDPYLQQVFLTGEISNFRPRANAHQYFSLKDDGAKISAVMFKGAFAKLKFRPEEGQKVLVVGRISLYEGSGNYQIYVEKMEPDGVGALFQALKQLQEKLTKEGLITAPKKPIPKYPKKIAVITSPSGAVIRDIITTVKRRYPIAKIVLFPTLVQGSLAAENIVSNLKQADALGFDTIIMGRGGGSIEDLWPFNEEIVARAIFAAKTPIISSVGHETDTTIADLVADKRAATPTAAAELAVPVLVDELRKISDFENALVLNLQKILQQKKQSFNQFAQSYVLTQPQRLYEGLSLKVDLNAQQLSNNFQKIFQKKTQETRVVQDRLQKTDLPQRLELTSQKVNQLSIDLTRGSQDLLASKKIQFEKTVSALNLLSPLNILERGFSYVTTNREIVKSSEQVAVGDEIQIHLHQGQITATVTNKTDQKDQKEEKNG
ncbi:exodeoxyribonuclease VII large subunit [Enterococcus timonensis]|uniref:exodeoxyribonuclease VII large subunit n=1 Tax=Enterococcus timonensis TaxID=1852364 RepID=UPI0008D93019|nr:exodeoxyribonuclease VII large subunit [Enterococcus timonensis]